MSTFNQHVKPADYKYFKEDGDPGFNPARNRWVIAQTLKKNKANKKRMHKKFMDELGERVQAVSAYLTSQHGAHSNKALEKYFGKSYVAYLRGQSILEDMMSKLIVKNDTKA